MCEAAQDKDGRAHIDAVLEAVEDLVVEIREEEVVLRPVASEPLTLELWQLDEHQEIFRMAFGKELIVEPIVRALENDHQSYT